MAKLTCLKGKLRFLDKQHFQHISEKTARARELEEAQLGSWSAHVHRGLGVGWGWVDKGNVCLGVLNGTEVHDGSTVILGDISLRGKLVVYDNTQQKIGWVQSECAKPQKSTGFAFFV
ncbi:hypothetical protein ZIOFF_039492 [Zingiber officinale]|uniref:Peptidase A1 domain-containing protein n=1 Tax=Zingiber officinale TaxID=94328 RepID=A0A8J5G4M2_ZINOF|nr:hypothetical protein ZIOFF_039492 [Zingiber officinale]